MPTLRLLTDGGDGKGHGGEIFACAYTPDNAFVLTGGWDGHLRLWDAANGGQVRDFRASDKPIAACAVSPDGEYWLTGSLDGLLCRWDPSTDEQISAFTPHARPLSAIVFGPNGLTLATASWDRHLILWDLTRDRQGKTLVGHQDIVSGCQFVPSGQLLVSWSYDATVRLWDVPAARLRTTLTAHNSRVTTGAVSPDGRWAASGGRDRTLKLWDLEAAREANTCPLQGEVQACRFLLDGASLLAADAHGRLTIHSVPDLEERAELYTSFLIQSGELSPSGNQFALGCADGYLRCVAVEGLEGVPLVVTALPTSRRNPTLLQRLLGRSGVIHIYTCTCPVCRHVLELSDRGGQLVTCPKCQRRLDVRRLLVPAPPR